jgi:colanic acid/amylovoran biosynthesis glycosyltransferase
MEKVLHIFRKLLPPTSTFIRNQVVYQSRYEPHIMYAEYVQGSMADELRSIIFCREVVTGNASTWLYRKFRILTPGVINRAVNFIRELNPAIIHVHYGVDMITFSKILEKVNIPVVVSFYGYDCTSFPKRFNGLGKYWLQKRVFRHKNLKAVFAMSPDMEKDLLAIGCPKELIRIHYYGSECKTFSFDRDYSDNETVNFTIISGLTAKKGHLVLLEAWKQLIGMTEKKVQLNIIGTGELREEIEKFIRENKLDTVKLAGPVQYGSEAHHSALQTSDVFVHPSVTAPNGDKEGIPGAVIEAMANGLPVISTFHAGIPSVIENGHTGILVQEYNIQQLAEALLLLTENPALREKIGRNARLFAISSLDIQPREMELEELYDEAIHPI